MNDNDAYTQLQQILQEPYDEIASLADSDLIQITVPDSPASLFPAVQRTESAPPLPPHPAMLVIDEAPTIIAQPLPLPLPPSPPKTETKSRTRPRGVTMINADLSTTLFALLKVVMVAGPVLAVGAVGYLFVNWVTMGYVRFWAGAPTAVAVVGTIVSLLLLLRVIIGLRSRYAGATTVPTAHIDDSLTRNWVTKMEDPTTKQAHGQWAYGDGQTFCAVGHLLELELPGSSQKGARSAVYRRMARKYGRRTLNTVIRMNDNGTSLPRIARYVRSRTAK